MTEKLVALARSFIGVTEKGKDNCGPEVERFQKAVDGKASGEPWCMAFVQYCVRELGPTRLYPSEHCLTVWNKSPADMRIPEPEPGCLVIWQMKNTAAGHVGIVERVDGDFMRTIEGNTSDSSHVERNGDGVYSKRRAVHGTGAMKVIGFLRVFN